MTENPEDGNIKNIKLKIKIKSRIQKSSGWEKYNYIKNMFQKILRH